MAWAFPLSYYYLVEEALHQLQSDIPIQVCDHLPTIERSPRVEA